MRAARLAYLLAQHPMHLHRALVRRGIALGWIDAFRPFWDSVRPTSVPITDYASFQWLCYYFTTRLRMRHPRGDHFDDRDAQYARLLSYILRREMHPLRWLPIAWHLRACRTVLEYGAGAAPFAHGVTTAGAGFWPMITVADLPGMLLDYCRWRFRGESSVSVVSIELMYRLPAWDGIVCTEVFEHLPDPVTAAWWMVAKARRVVCFDFVEEAGKQGRTRAETLEVFRANGTLRGPDARGLYVWTSGRYIPHHHSIADAGGITA